MPEEVKPLTEEEIAERRSFQMCLIEPEDDARWLATLDERDRRIESETARKCAEAVCPYCAVHVRAGFTFQEAVPGQLEHLTTTGRVHLCKALAVRRLFPAAFEEAHDAAD